MRRCSTFSRSPRPVLWRRWGTGTLCCGVGHPGVCSSPGWCWWRSCPSRSTTFPGRRSCSLSGYLPWISAIVPEPVRGRFLALDQAASQSALLLTVALTAWFLSHTDNPASFGVLFGASLVLAAGSLLYLRKIPDAPTQGTGGSEEVPWKAMLGHPPFRQLVIFHAVVMLAMSGGGLFFVPFARDQFQCSDSLFLILHLMWGTVFVLTSLRAGRWLDRMGSRPVLFLCVVVMGIHWLGWGAVAAHLLPFSWGTFAFQQATAGIGLALYNSAHMRLLMGIVPAMGRSHFFALFSVAGSVVAGLAPLGWGLSADALAGFRIGTGVQLNGFVILYATIALIMIPALILLGRVQEARAASTEELIRELVLETPWRSITRWWNRRPFA
ncbi:MAG: MFS transporter [Verrucomicrobia bacterium]|nr:MFS transporter [Verrucomicrobiota bacterium]